MDAGVSTGEAAAFESLLAVGCQLMPSCGQRAIGMGTGVSLRWHRLESLCHHWTAIWYEKRDASHPSKRQKQEKLIVSDIALI